MSAQNAGSVERPAVALPGGVRSVSIRRAPESDAGDGLGRARGASLKASGDLGLLVVERVAVGRASRTV